MTIIVPLTEMTNVDCPNTKGKGDGDGATLHRVSSQEGSQEGPQASQ
jgi:hypothetical protein